VEVSSGIVDHFRLSLEQVVIYRGRVYFERIKNSTVLRSLAKATITKFFIKTRNGRNDSGFNRARGVNAAHEQKSGGFTPSFRTLKLLSAESIWMTVQIRYCGIFCTINMEIMMNQHYITYKLYFPSGYK